MKLIAKFFLIIASVGVLTPSALAECFRLSRSSCWDLVNQTFDDIVISCRDDHADLFGERLVYSGATIEQQFPDSFNDGRGAFGPDYPIRCNVKFADNSSMQFRFATLGSGDRIEIRVQEDGAKVTVRSFWTRGLAKTFSFRRNR